MKDDLDTTSKKIDKNQDLCACKLHTCNVTCQDQVSSEIE